MMSADALARAKMAQQQQQSDAEMALKGQQLGIEKIATEGKNRYYDAQADTHRLDVENRGKIAGEKRVNVLMDAFRKAKTPDERDAIRQELTRNGFNVAEQDTDLPEIPGQPGAKPAAPKEEKGVGAFLNLFGDQMSKAFQGGAGGDQVAAGGASSSLDGLQTPAVPQKPKRGGKFVVTDKEGNPVVTYDEPLHKSQGRQRILDAAEPLIGGGRTPENEAAAQRAADAAAGALDATGDSKYALDTFMKLYAAETGQFKKEHRQGVGGGGGPAGPTKVDIKLSEFDNKTVNDIIHRVETTYHTKAASDSENDALQGLKMIQDLDSGTGDYAALANYMKSMSGKAVSDKERAAFTGGEGFWAEMETRGNRYLNGGRYAPEFMRELEKVLMATVERAREAKSAAAKVAAGEARGSRVSEAGVDVASGHFSGTFAQAPPTSLRPAAKTPTAVRENAPSTGQSDQDLVRAWKGRKK